VEQVNAQQAALREQRRRELQAGIQSQLGRESTMNIEAARERAALERERAAQEFQTGAATTAFGRAKELAQLPKQDFSLTDTELFMKDPEAYRRMMEIRQETGRVPPPPPSKLLTPEEEAQYIRMHPPRPAAAKTLSPYSESNIVNRLQTRLDSQSKVANELQRQISVMDAGLNAARRGDMAAGSQAVLVTFQKILDPLSVVRESEYARSAAGQSLLNRISGAVGRLQSGGAGIPLPELEKFAQLAREMSENSTKHLGTVQKQIQDTGKRYGIPPELITFPDVGTGGGAGGGGERIRVRNKATGKTGTISPQYFDPNKYEKQ
jgi:hypothetical protein